MVKGVEDWGVLSRGKMLGMIFPGVDHAPEDSRLPHSVTRGARRITILRAKATTARSKLLSITTPHGGYTSCDNLAVGVYI